jgi:purine-binding chemotaxis protein CheW
LSIRISSAEIQLPPGITQGNAAQECLTGVLNHSERLLVVLDLDRMFSDEEKAVFETLE